MSNLCSTVDNIPDFKSGHFVSQDCKSCEASYFTLLINRSTKKAGLSTGFSHYHLKGYLLAVA
jgi:hypothetical protein